MGEREQARSPHINSPMEQVGFWALNQLKLSWDDNICKLIHKKCHHKIYYNDIKYRMALITIHSVLTNTLNGNPRAMYLH